jgi:hypothetical protein
MKISDILFELWDLFQQIAYGIILLFAIIYAIKFIFAIIYDYEFP